MRKLFISLALLLSPIIGFAEPWGVLKDATSQELEDIYLLNKFVLSDGISYCTYGSKKRISDKYISLFLKRLSAIGLWVQPNGLKIPAEMTNSKT